nr:MAG TPA: hypothetical protein [Caudoviricetes sp.]
MKPLSHWHISGMAISLLSKWGMPLRTIKPPSLCASGLRCPRIR